jgi:hypothetical protein
MWKRYLSIVLLIIVALVVGCASQTETGTPTTPEAVESAQVSESTDTAVPTATVWLTPTPNPTATPAATDTPPPAEITVEGLPTPAAALNLAKVQERLLANASFAFDLLAESEKTAGMHFEGEWVQSPQSWRVRQLQGENVLMEFVSIGEREWASIGPGQMAASCEGWEALDDSDMTHDVCNLGTQSRALVATTMTAAFPDLDVSPEEDAVAVDGVPCYRYAWEDESGESAVLFVAAETGQPVLYEGQGAPHLTMRFSALNDPANAFAAPLTDMPEKLHIDDARLAVNGLQSFQYSTVADMGKNTDQPVYYIVHGVSLQSKGAWYVRWYFEDAEKTEADFEVLFEGGQGLIKAPGMTDFLPASMLPDAEQLVRDADPFAWWPNTAYMQVGTLQAGEGRTVDGEECAEYLFTAEVSTAQGTAYHELRLCVTPEEMIPLREEYSAGYAEDVFDLTITREWTHFDDPANADLLPEEAE